MSKLLFASTALFMLIAASASAEEKAFPPS